MTTAYTSPAPIAVNIDSVVCSCCDTRWWPEQVPRFPEGFICEVCEAWFHTFSVSGGLPVFGPCRSVRRLLAGQPVTSNEFVTDDSAWIAVQATRSIFERVQRLLQDVPDANR